MYIQGIAEAGDFARLLNLIPLISTGGCLISIYGEIVSHDYAIIVFRGFGIYKAGTNVIRNDICLSRHRIAIPAAAGVQRQRGPQALERPAMAQRLGLGDEPGRL